MSGAWWRFLAGGVGLALAPMWAAVAADEIVLANGRQLSGEVVERTPDHVRVRTVTGTTAAIVTYPAAQVKTAPEVPKTAAAPTPKATTPTTPTTPAGTKGVPPGKPEAPTARPAAPTTPTTPAAPTTRVARSRDEVEALIDQAGKTPPDWWESTKLDYPQTLDLTMPKPQPKEPWNPGKYLGAYMVSVINPNPAKWKGAAKLFVKVMEVNKNDADKVRQAMSQLVHIYGDLLADPARAAFWLRKAEKYAPLWAGEQVDLANCYFQLGNQQMAEDLLKRIGDDMTRDASVIRLWAAMGKSDIALKLADNKARDDDADVAHLVAGDVYRALGRYKEAMAEYQKAVNCPKERAGRDIKKNVKRAQNNLDAIKLVESLDLSRIPDGTYRGSGEGYRGEVVVVVTVAGGRIADVKVAQHKEDWFFTSLTVIPQRIIANQGVKGVDGVSGATMTCEAIINGTIKALGSGMK